MSLNKRRCALSSSALRTQLWNDETWLLLVWTRVWEKGPDPPLANHWSPKPLLSHFVSPALTQPHPGSWGSPSSGCSPWPPQKRQAERLDAIDLGTALNYSLPAWNWASAREQLRTQVICRADTTLNLNGTRKKGVLLICSFQARAVVFQRAIGYWASLWFGKKATDFLVPS